MKMQLEYARNLRDEINDAIAEANVESLDGSFGAVMIDSNVTIYIYRSGLKELDVNNDDISGLQAFGDKLRAVATTPTDHRYSLVAIEVLDKYDLVLSKYYLSDESHTVQTYTS